MDISQLESRPFSTLLMAPPLRQYVDQSKIDWPKIREEVLLMLLLPMSARRWLYSARRTFVGGEGAATRRSALKFRITVRCHMTRHTKDI